MVPCVANVLRRRKFIHSWFIHHVHYTLCFGYTILISPVCLGLKGGFWPQSRITDGHCGNNVVSLISFRQRTWVQSGSHSQPSNFTSQTVVCRALICIFFSYGCCQYNKITWQGIGSSFDKQWQMIHNSTFAETSFSFRFSSCSKNRALWFPDGNQGQNRRIWY